MSAGRDDSRLMQIVLDIRGGAGPPQSLRLAGRAGAGLCPGGGRRRGGDPWGRLLLDDARRQGPTGGARSPALGCALRRQSGRQLRPSLSATLAALDAFVEGRGGGGTRRRRPAHPLPGGRKKMWTAPTRRSRSRPSGAPAKSGWRNWGVVRGLQGRSPGGLRAVHPAVRGCSPW